MSVFDNLVGQARAVEAMKAAASGYGMSHAWLFTGPPGSGDPSRDRPGRRARVRAGGLRRLPRLPHGAGRHPRRRHRRAHREALHRRRRGPRPGPPLALAPVGRRWQVMIVEDADRLTDQACNALLKAIEEPTERTVWMLCAPTVEDVLPTIRSRCRLVTLATPSDEERRVPDPSGQHRPHLAATDRPPRATSAGPARWPATRPPATAAARSSPSRPD